MKKVHRQRPKRKLHEQNQLKKARLFNAKKGFPKAPDINNSSALF